MDLTKPARWLPGAAAFAVAAVVVFLTATGLEANESRDGESMMLSDSPTAMGSQTDLTTESSVESDDDGMSEGGVEQAAESEDVDGDIMAADGASTDSTTEASEAESAPVSEAEATAEDAGEASVEASDDASGTEAGETAATSEASTDAGDAAVTEDEVDAVPTPDILSDGVCTLSDLWTALGAILEDTDFPALGVDMALDESACTTLIGMVEAGTLDLEDGESCDLLTLLSLAGPLEDAGSIPDVELPLPVCIGLTTGDDVPIITLDEDSASVEIPTPPIVQLP